MEKFTKANVKEELQRRLERLEGEYGFDSGNGWSQVESKGEAVNRAYGEYSVIRDFLRNWF